MTLEHALWRDSSEDRFPFALIDGSWCPLLYGHLLASKLDWCNLYQGATAAEHLHDAPLLIALKKGDDLLPWLSKQEHGLTCGIFGTASIPALRSWSDARLHALAEKRVHGHFVASEGIEEEPEPHPLLLLRKHFRRFTRIVAEDGRERQFRFYDPEVLRMWLSYCPGSELASVFGPVQAFLAETSDGLCEFTLTQHPQRLAVAEMEVLG